MQQDGVIASFCNAGGVELNTTVLPFILRGVRLIGVDSAATAMPLRAHVWQRLATDLLPKSLLNVAHLVPFEQLPETFQPLLQGTSTGRSLIQFAAAR